MKVICELASGCGMEKECNHAVAHEHEDGIGCSGGICGVVSRSTRCIEVEEQPMEQKLEGVEVKHTILQDQEKKADAGKLRYDLIEYGIINSVALQEYDARGLMNLTTNMEWDEEYYLCEWIATAIVALGNMSNFLHELARVYTFGAKQYGDESWKTVPNAEARYLGAMQRHIYEFQHGNYLNYQDDMLYHIAQVAWNAISLLWFKQNKGK